MEEQAYINATFNVRIPTYVQSGTYAQIDNAKESLASYLYDNPAEILEYENMQIRSVDVDIE
ncbi:DUF3113 family protein [Staphylococcus simiae]|uniref:Uncharacterized protein n=1 Tax=Staphylococcus simiae CCM 7213 = CCUG 51256 TaxID=911238 RepID=G5JH61_9STAP|nr:DUF3113 family protein [Staphylococcus simiae]EHJ08409.1 hypothetical protein SS7213T_03950 [Staphylococcus simiae CCM 7213 = CCUG 51256]PNZ12631.1 hypothetical protein CD113_06345 [Staphylococcus simiae]SNV67083.1 phage protein [Staphylococcus simiae]